MKKIKTKALLLSLFVVLLFGSCEFLASRVRPLPPVIQLYNSALQRTLKLMPNDTLYVQVSGLAANSFYEVECRSPNESNVMVTTSSILAQSDADGVIQPTALWYDIGFKWNDVTGKLELASPDDLGIATFDVHVKSVDSTATDFALDFFVVYNTQIARPQPIVMAGEMVSNVFNLENAFDSGDTLYVKVANIDKGLPTGQTTARVYIVPFSGANYEDGSPIDNAYFYVDTDLQSLKDGLSIPWLNNSGDPTIPTSERGRAFSVIVDFDNNGYFNVLKEGTTDYYLDGIDGNGVAGFIVRQPPITIAQTVSLNLVSGGIFTYNWQNYQYDYDYRDSYRADGSDTKVAYYYGVGPGVKVIWNPYAYYQGWDNDPSGTALYYGRWIDLYIIKSGGTTTGWDVTNLNDTSILMRKLRLPVQYGCQNGLNQQTIWPAPMTAGDYALVLDMDESATITDGDIIDDLNRSGSVRLISDKRSGFSIQ